MCEVRGRTHRRGNQRSGQTEKALKGQAGKYRQWGAS